MFKPRPTGFLALFLVLSAIAAPYAGERKEEEPPDRAAIAANFRKHCVKVYCYPKSSDGEAPALGTFAADIANLRTSLLGGYWWSDNQVLVGDPGLNERFVRAIEISTPDSNRRWQARIVGRFHRLQAVLLEVFPDEDGDMPKAYPMRFADAAPDKARIVCSYEWDNGEWRLSVGGGTGPAVYSDAGAETLTVEQEGILVDRAGSPIGAAFGKELAVAAGEVYWLGKGLSAATLVEADEYDELQRELALRLKESVLETRINLRVDIDDDDTSWSMNLSDDGVDESTTLIRTPGLTVGRRLLLIPVNLNAASIARIESIQVVLPDGKEAEAEFAGAFREYMAIAARVDSELFTAAPPAGFKFLNPFLIPEEAFLPGEEFLALPDKGLFLRWQIDYALGRRRERADTDRWLGLFRGFREAPVVLTRTNEENGALSFDLEGKLIALALAPRIPHSENAEEIYRDAGFRPLGHLHEVFARDEAIDPTLVPTEAENGRRLIGVGVEWQGLKVDSAKLFGAEKATRGGKIGLLVSHVYPGSEAASMGLREQDILLRISVEGQDEPIELTPEEGHMGGFSLLDLEDMSVESVQRYMANLPPPWPSRENTITKILTTIGVNREAALEYVREGEMRRAEFTTRFLPPDYRNAPKTNLKALGVTVKPITYEVARYFRRAEGSGVIISRAEEGGRGAVAGLHPYLLVVRVDGAEVDGYDDFLEKVAPFEEGEREMIELTVEGFGKTRLVKIER